MAHPALPPRTRAYRHLQPFLLRRSAGRPGSSGTARGRGIAGSRPRQKEYLATALSVDPRLGGHLHRNGTRVVKFFLHLSKEEQRKRFLARIDEPDKNWKFSLADVKEREYWNDYMKAYAGCVSATTIVPADDKANAWLIISQIILNILEELKLDYPKLSKAHRKELRAIRKLLEK